MAISPTFTDPYLLPESLAELGMLDYCYTMRMFFAYPSCMDNLDNEALIILFRVWQPGSPAASSSTVAVINA
jgi:hypothetical protein